MVATCNIAVRFPKIDGGMVQIAEFPILMTVSTLSGRLKGAKNNMEAEEHSPGSIFRQPKETLQNPIKILIVNSKLDRAILPGNDGGQFLAFEISLPLHPFDGIKRISVKPGTQNIRKPVPEYYRYRICCSHFRPVGIFVEGCEVDDADWMAIYAEVWKGFHI